MRFATVFSIATLGLATGVFSSPGFIADKRDLASIEGVVQAVTTQVNLLGSDIKAGNLNKVISDSTQLVSVINSGVTTVDASAALSYSDSLTLSTKIGTLISAVNVTITDLIGASKGIVAAGLVSTTLSSLNEQYAASNSLAAAITSKVPTSMQGLSKELAGYITTSIQMGINYYTSLPATSSTPASSPTSAPTSAPASTPSSPASSHTSPASSPTSSPSHGASTTGGAKTSKKPCSTTGSSSTALVKPTSGMASSSTGVSMTLTTITTTITTSVPCSGTSTGSTGPSYTPTTITTTITTAVPCTESSGAATTAVNTALPAGSTTEVVGGVTPTWTSAVAPGSVVSTSVPGESTPAAAGSSSTSVSPSVPEYTGGASLYKMDISYYGMAAVAAIAFAL